MTDEDRRAQRPLNLMAILTTITMGVVAWGVNQITTQMSHIADDQHKFVIEFDLYKESMEHRISTVEEYQKVSEDDRLKIHAAIEEVAMRRKR